jgi:hypothetical protein
MRASKKMLRAVLLIGAILILISRFKSEWVAPIFMTFAISGGAVWLIYKQYTALNKMTFEKMFNLKNKQIQRDNFINEDVDGGF